MKRFIYFLLSHNRVRSFQRAALVAEAEAESLKEELAYMKQQMKDSMRAVAEKHAAARDQDKKTIQVCIPQNHL